MSCTHTYILHTKLISTHVDHVHVHLRTFTCIHYLTGNSVPIGKWSELWSIRII